VCCSVLEGSFIMMQCVIDCSVWKYVTVCYCDCWNMSMSRALHVTCSACALVCTIQLEKLCVAICCSGRPEFKTSFTLTTLQHTAAHCGTLQHTAAHCNTLQHAARRCKTPHLFKLCCRHVFKSLLHMHHTCHSFVYGINCLV